jgi:hypothetical protein
LPHRSIRFTPLNLPGAIGLTNRAVCFAGLPTTDGHTTAEGQLEGFATPRQIREGEFEFLTRSFVEVHYDPNPKTVEVPDYTFVVIPCIYPTSD